MEDKQIRQLLEYAIEGSILAGEKILEIYETDDFDVRIKSDNSPLTAADSASNEVILSFLRKTELPVLSEEGTDISFEERKQWDYFWLVDPLDGTKEFIKRNGDFTVNIALVHRDTPVAGVIYVPVSNELYFADMTIGAYKIDLSGIQLDSYALDKLTEISRKLPFDTRRDKYVVVGSRSHMNGDTQIFIDSLRETHQNIEILSRGSSLKICMVAEGYADIYPRFAPTMEWDIAAGHAIAKAAGCEITRYDGKSDIKYNKEKLLNSWFVVKSSSAVRK